LRLCALPFIEFRDNNGNINHVYDRDHFKKTIRLSVTNRWPQVGVGYNGEADFAKKETGFTAASAAPGMSACV
jgi:hypothetical protein